MQQRPHISHTEKSKFVEWISNQRSCSFSWTTSVAASNSASRLAWLTGTPLGTPVVPEV